MGKPRNPLKWKSEYRLTPDAPADLIALRGRRWSVVIGSSPSRKQCVASCRWLANYMAGLGTARGIQFRAAGYQGRKLVEVVNLVVVRSNQ